MSFRKRLILTALTLGVAPLILGGTIFYIWQSRGVTSLELSSLSAIADYKVNATKDYFNANLRIAEVLGNNTIIAELYPLLANNYRNFDSPAYLQAKNNLDELLAYWKKRNSEVVDIMMVNSNGVIVYVSNEEHIADDVGKPLYDPTQQVVTRGLEDTFISDVFENERDSNLPGFLVSTPILDSQNSPIGLLVLETRAFKLFSIIQDRAGLGESGETLYVKKMLDSDSGDEVAIILNPLFHDENTTFTTKIELNGAGGAGVQNALLGKNGQGKNLDYRGVTVLSAWRYIPSQNKGLVVKIDESEALNYLQQTAVAISIIILALSVIVFWFAWYLSGLFNRQLLEVQKFSLAVDSAQDQIVITDVEGVVVYVNQSVKRITGFDPKEVLGVKAGKLWGGLMPKEFYKKLWHVVKVQKRSYSGEITNMRKDGSKYLASVAISPVLDERQNVRYFVSVERDITTEKEREQRLENLTSRLTLATNSAHIGVWEWDVKNNVLTWDHEMYRLYGIKKEDFSGAYDAWQSGLHPEDKERGDKEIQLALSGKKDFDTHFRVVWPDGSIRYLRAFALVERDFDGQPERMIGVNFDITQQMEIDKAKTEFVSLASHQLRTPMTAIKWYSEMLMSGDAGKLSSEQKEYTQEILRGNQRMVDLVNSLLNVSRVDLGTLAVEPEPLQFAEVANSVLKELTPQIKTKKLNIVTEFAKLPDIFADPRLLRIIFQNLLSNSIKYTPPKGEIKLSLLKSGQSVGIIVKDNGCGIPIRQQGKIFSKLFRADNAKEIDNDGNGLGLYLVKAVVDQVGGKVWFESEENHGTIFHVMLPLSGMKAKAGSKTLNA